MFAAIYMILLGATNEFVFIRNESEDSQFMDTCLNKLQNDNPEFMKDMKDTPGRGSALFLVFDYFRDKDQMKEAAYFLFEAASHGSSEAIDEMDYYLGTKNQQVDWNTILQEKENTLNKLYAGLHAAHTSTNEVMENTAASSTEHTPGPDSGSDPETEKGRRSSE